MTKAELKKSHDAMARFLIHLCRFSDKQFGREMRSGHAAKQYARAVRLIKRSGLKFESNT